MARGRLLWCLVLAGIIFTAELRICVHDTHSGLPVAGAKVEITGISQNTDIKGCLYIPNIRQGTHILIVHHDEYRSLSREIEVSSDFINEERLSLRPLIWTAEPVMVLARYEAESGDLLVNKPFEAVGSLKSLSEQLSGTIFIEQGSKATISIDGSRPEDVLIIVDGHIVPQDENGLRDIAFINPEEIRSIELIKSGIPARYASEAKAGLIVIETKRPFGTAVSTVLGTGSYGNIKGQGSFDFGLGKNMTSRLSVFYEESEGNFPYSTERYPDSILIRENNHISKYGLDFRTNYTSSRAILTHNLSINHFDDGMPGSVDVPTPLASRSGYGLRTSLNSLVPIGSKSSIEAGISLCKNRIDMLSPRPYIYIPVDSEQDIDALSFDIQFDKRLWGSFHPKVGASYYRESFALKNLNNRQHDISPKNRDRYSTWLEAGYEKELWSRADIKAISSIRADVFGEEQSKISKAFAVSSVYRPTKGDIATNIGASFGYNESYSQPAFNDLYWMRDAFAEGNPDLSPETARRHHISINASAMYKRLRLAGNVEFFERQIDSVIVWNRGFDGLYRPINLPSEVTTGRNDFISLRYNEIAGISYSNSVIDCRQRSPGTFLDGYYMPYRPEYLRKLSLELTKFDFRLAVHHRSVGKTYMLPANTKWSDPYQVLDVSIGHTATMKHLTADFRFDVNNVLNERYSVLKGYPNIGRNYYMSLKITYRINNIRNNIN